MALSCEKHKVELYDRGGLAKLGGKNSLIEIGEWVAEHGISGAGPFRAARELLLGRPPRVGQATGAALAREGETDLEAARRLVVRLDETTLPIQGPPGSGKTYTGARMILRLSARQRVDHRHQPHVGNFASSLPRRRRFDVRQSKGREAGPRRPWSSGATRLGQQPARDGRRSAADALWASPKMTGAIDVLFLMRPPDLATTSGGLASHGQPRLSGPAELDQPPADASARCRPIACPRPRTATMPADLGLFSTRRFTAARRLH
jgi:uncharacterized protein